MISSNTQKNKVKDKGFGGIASNTRLIPPNTTPTTTNKCSEATDSKSLQEKSSTNKSSNVFHNHSDWLTLNFTGLLESQFNELVKRLGKDLATVEKGKTFSQGEKAKSYKNTISSPIGFKGAYNSYKLESYVDSLYDVTISLTGEYFAPMTTVEQWELYRYLYLNYSPTCSRTDTSIDDYSFKSIPLVEMIEAYRRGDYFDFRKYHFKTDEEDPKNPITVHYFGAEGSKRLVRVYNHKNESLRLETQFRGEYAQVAFEDIANLKKEDESDEEWSRIVEKTIGKIAIGAIDFRNKSKLKNQKKACKSKTKRLSFWQAFVDQIGKPHLIRTQTAKLDMESHQRSFNWLEKTASKTIAKAFYLLGHDKFISYVLRLVKSGESKFTPQDRKQIKYLQNNLEHLDL